MLRIAPATLPDGLRWKRSFGRFQTSRGRLPRGVWRICRQQLVDATASRITRTPPVGGNRSKPAWLGMGKLGGQELNYSSDVDLLIVYTEEGQVSTAAAEGRFQAAVQPERAQVPQQAFRGVHREVSRLTPDGALYRVDMRLRPGRRRPGPWPVRSRGYENYYAQWGSKPGSHDAHQGARVAATSRWHAEFLERSRPFRYPRFHQEAVLR